MSLNPNESAAFGMFKAVRDSEGIFGPTNKVDGKFPGAGNINKQNEYTSKLEDDEIIDLISQWKSEFRQYYEDIEKSQEGAFSYWLGKQAGKDLTIRNSTSDPAPLVDNVIFTMVETMLPLVTRANPDPVVSSDSSDAGQKLSRAISAALVYEADRQKLRRKLARGLRRWTWDRLGVFKVTWDIHLKEIKTEVIPAKRFIFDKDGYIDEGGRFRGDYLGEKKKDTAGRLIEMFAEDDAELKAKIKQECDGKLATKLDYIEWWYKGRDVFYTLGDQTVLGKFKNPNWNYDIPEQEAQEPETDDVTGEVISPATEYQPEQKGINFHKEPQSPHVFLSVFSSGVHPYDETSLIMQNEQLQDIVNRRLRQIDKNVDNMNEGLVLSGKSFTTDQAAGAANALRAGKAIIVPNGDVRAAATHLPAPALPSSVFEQLEDMRQEIMNVGGTSGSVPQGLEQQKSVRGKIMIQQADVSRFAHITEALEQVADSIYNFWVQFMVVYYDDTHYVTAAGVKGGVDILEIKNQMFQFVQMLDITVKEGSLIPKDPLTQRNEAMDLWAANAIDPISFFKRLDEPDPIQAAESMILWELAKAGNMQAMQAYMPSLAIFGNPQGQPGQPNGAQEQPQPAQGNPAGAPGSQPAVQQQESALLKSVPL